MTTLSIPQTLQDRLRKQKVIPFVGAGVSMAVQRHDGTRMFPSWKQLLLSAADRLQQETKGKEAAAIRALLELDEPDYLYAAQQARKALGAVWYEYLANQIDLSRADVADDSLALAQAIWELNSQLVLTTNYDRVLRWACPQSGDLQEWDIDAVAEQAQFLRQGVKRPTVWHLHGHIGNKTNLILTPDGYERLYHDDAMKGKHPAALQTLRSNLAAYSFLFVGFSLDDEHFGAQLKAISDVYDGATGPHYALVKEAYQASFKKDHPEIGVIPFADFGEPLVQVVKTLSEVVCVAATADSTATATVREQEILSAVSPASSAHYSLDNPVFFVPYRAKGDQVIGRKDALDAVHKQLTEGHRTSIGQAASFHGLGGLGKTQLAVEFAYQYKHEYPNGVIWITADQDIESQLTKLSDEAKWLAPSSEPKQKQDAAKNRLKSYSDCLLIFDNLDRFDSIADYLPDLQANPHILVTSRYDFADFPPIPLDPLSDEDAYRLLVQEAGSEPNTDAGLAAAQGIAHELGGLPLALELAGAYLRHRQLGWERYYALLQENPRAALKGRFLSSFTKHEADLYATLKISDYVFDEEPLLRDIVDLLTWSGAAPMNLALMSALLAVKSETELFTALALGESLRLLVKSPKGDGYALHRLVSQVRREEIPLEQRPLWISDICQRLGDWFQPIREDFSQLAAYEAQLDHLRAWQQNASPHATQHASRLLWLQAYPSYHRGRYLEIKELVEKALKVFADSQCEDRGLEAHLYNDLGFAYNQSRDRWKALEYAERALAIRQGVYEEEHPDIAMSLNNVGNSYGELGESRRALEYQERALAIWQKLYGEEHPDTARSLQNIGISYRKLDEPQRALEYQKRALAIRQKLYGEEHPDTASSLNSVGVSYGELGEPRRALEYHERALAIWQKLYGEEHPETAVALHNVGNSYGELGEPRKDLYYTERALVIHKKVLGDLHPDTVRTLIGKTIALDKLGRVFEAFSLLDKTLQMLPKDHIRYAEVQQRQQQLAQALPGAQRSSKKHQKKKRR